MNISFTVLKELQMQKCSFINHTATTFRLFRLFVFPLSVFLSTTEFLSHVSPMNIMEHQCIINTVFQNILKSYAYNVS